MVEPGAVLVPRATYRLQFRKGLASTPRPPSRPISPGPALALGRGAALGAALARAAPRSCPGSYTDRRILSDRGVERSYKSRS
jgi:hypothetical protein